MTAPAKPGPLPFDTYARAAWQNGYEAAVAHRIWQPGDVYGLELLARAASLYVKIARSRAGLEPVEDDELPELRRLIREHMRAFGVLPADAPDFLSEVRADGLDSDIADMCGISRG